MFALEFQPLSETTVYRFQNKKYIHILGTKVLTHTFKKNNIIILFKIIFFQRAVF